MHWQQLDLNSAQPSESMLAQWAAHAHRRVEPYWLLAHAMGYPGFANAHDPLPVMVEFAVAHRGSRFELQMRRASDLGALIALLDEKVRRFQLDAPRTKGVDSVFALSVQEPIEESWLRFIGIIDDGFPFAHPNLLRFDHSGQVIRGPRFISIWDQGRTPGAPWSGSLLPFGAALRRSAMKHLIGTDRARLDERAVYRAARYQVHAAAAPHGSGVTQLLAGSDPTLPDGSRTDIPGSMAWPVIGVQLPEPAIADTAGAWLGFYALHGLRHIVQTASRVARFCRRPWHVVVNLSYGSLAGPHDGSSMFEQAMDELVDSLPCDRARLDIVLASGNAQALPIHAEREIASGSTGSFRCSVPPDNPRESYVEIWLPATDSQGKDVDPGSFAITVQAPDASAHGIAVGSAHLMRVTSGGLACGGVVFARHVAQGLHGTMVLLMLRPTRIGDTDRAPAGVWTVSVHNAHAEAVTVHAWVERNDIVGRRRRPQQARFVADPDDPHHVNGSFSLSHCAHGDRVTVAGAVRQSDSRVTDYSGTGYAPSGRRPDFYAPGDLNASLNGVQVPGWHAGQWTRMSGTSIAAPWVARWMMAQCPAARLGPTYELHSVDDFGPPSWLTIRGA